MSDEEQKRAGRGGLALLAANVFFLLLGFVQQALLPRAIGRADYGALSRVSAVSTAFNNVIVTSSIQGVSRVTAAAGDAEKQAFRAMMRVHVGISALATALLLGAAPFVAHFQDAPDMLTPLLVITGVLAVYGVYAPLVGYLNGRRMFGRQAALNVAAAILRTGGMLGFGYFFVKKMEPLARGLGTTPGVLGAAFGAVFASVGVLMIALAWTGTGASVVGARPSTVPSAREYIRLIAPVMVAQLFVNLLMQADIFMLGRWVSLAAQAAHDTGGAVGPSGAILDPAKAANEWLAVYRACQLFAFLPYQFLFSVTQVLFPMLAKAQKDEGKERVAELVARGSRIGAVVCGLMVAVIVAMPQPMLRLAYDPDIARAGAPVLRVLVLGQAAFAMFGLVTTILVSLGRERAAMGLTALALAMLIVSCVLFLPGKDLGGDQLQAAATAVVAAIIISLVVAVVVAKRTAGAFIPLKTAIRVSLVVGRLIFVQSAARSGTRRRRRRSASSATSRIMPSTRVTHVRMRSRSRAAFCARPTRCRTAV